MNYNLLKLAIAGVNMAHDHANIYGNLTNAYNVSYCVTYPDGMADVAVSIDGHVMVADLADVVL